MTLAIANSVTTHRAGEPVRGGDAVVTINHSDLIAALLGGSSVHQEAASTQAQARGDASALSRLAGWIDRPDPTFPIVVPKSQVPSWAPASVRRP